MQVKLESYGTTEVPEFLLEYAGIYRTPDILPLLFKLVHANRNRNFDEFTEPNLLKALKTVESKSLNWNHTDEFIGTITKAFYVKVKDGKVESITSSNESQDSILSKVVPQVASANQSIESILKLDPQEKSHILAIGIVWKHRDTVRARAGEIEERSKNGKLMWSMETFFKEFECSDCHKMAASEKDECEHLMARFTSGGKTGRILHALNFCGAAVVTDPADIDADNIALGVVKSEDNKMSFKVFETQEDFDKAIAEAVAASKEIDTYKASVAELQTQLSEASKGLTAKLAEIETLKAEIAAKHGKMDEMMKEKEMMMKDMEEMKKKDKRKMGEARLVELTSAGLKVSEDMKEAMIVELSEKTPEMYGFFKKAIEASVAKIDVPAVASATIPAHLTVKTEQEIVTASVDVKDNDENKLFDKVFGLGQK